MGRLAASSTQFDAVVCSRVLCTIENPAEIDSILSDLRRLVSGSGAAFVAVCNPFYLDAASTELAEKHIPAEHEYEETFRYTKTLAVNGKQREEVHRSFTTYKRAFANAGLRIEAVQELDGADTRALLPGSDHLVFRLRPAPGAWPKVSLLIKTCLMEWRIIERFVRHQVAQLEEPGRFHEKIVVVDPSEGPFLRQYEDPNAEAHRAAMNRLIEQGIVDRVVYAPQRSRNHPSNLPEMVRSGV